MAHSTSSNSNRIGIFSLTVGFVALINTMFFTIPALILANLIAYVTAVPVATSLGLPVVIVLFGITVSIWCLISIPSAVITFS